MTDRLLRVALAVDNDDEFLACREWCSKIPKQPAFGGGGMTKGAIEGLSPNGHTHEHALERARTHINVPSCDACNFVHMPK